MNELMIQEPPQSSIISFNNDVFFKCMLSGEDEKSKELRGSFIEVISKVKPERTVCRNTEFIPDSFVGKRLILDVLLEDEKNILYNFEMQTYGFGPNLYLRFQAYGYRLALKQLERGDDYKSMKPFHQIIFINTLPKGKHRLIDHMVVKDDDNEVECCNTLHRTYVYLPMAMEIFKAKGYAGMTEFELLCYVLAYGPNDDILKLNRRMVNIVVEKYKEMKQNEQLWSWADSHARAEQFVKACIMEAKETGFHEGELHGEKKGEKKGEERGEKRGVEKGEKRGEKKGIKKPLLKQIKKKYHTDASEWLDSLNEEQLLNVSDLILDYDSFQELQDFINSQK